MSYEVTDEISEIDLSKLISFSMSFQPLQLLFHGILKRVKEVEAENQQQDEEIDQIKKELEEMRQRDADREAKLEDLLQQQKELQEKQAILAEEEERKAKELKEMKQSRILSGEQSHILAEESGAQYTDLSALWDEVEKIKKQLGVFSASGFRHSIEQLYEARKRKSIGGSASLDNKQLRKVSEFPAETAIDVGTTKGDAILDRAKEDLFVSDEHVSLSALESRAPTPGEAMEPSHAESEKKKLEEVQHRDDQPETKSYTSSFKKKRPMSAFNVFSLQKDKPEYHSMGAEKSAFGFSDPRSTSDRLSPSFDVPLSVNDRLRQDANDIEYLNRVVAEILNEMKDLHADVDFIRTVATDTGGDGTPSVIGKQELKSHDDFQRTVESSKDDSADTIKALIATTESGVASNMDNLRKLKDRIDALEHAQERANDKLETAIGALSGSEENVGVSPVRLAVVEAAVKTVEKQLADLQNIGLRNCDRDLEALERAVAKIQKEIEALERAYATLDEKKKDKDTRRSSSGATAKDEDKKTQVASPIRSLPSSLSTTTIADINDLLRKMEELQGRTARAEEFIRELDEEKANRSAIQRINDDLRHLRQLLELGAGKHGDDAVASLAAAMQEELLQKVQQQLADNVQNINKIREGTADDLEALRNYVEKLDHCKADAKLVANKAERDYVENALERLMREVEQVLNATNAGLIDTLDKSLNVLRDMLDGKATKNDMDGLRRLINEEHVGGGAPDALLGFRGFRCLGCNRAVETMRPRAMANRLQPFVNRLPQNHSSDVVVASLDQGTSDDRSGKPAMLKNN